MNCSNYKSNDGICISVQPSLDNPLINVDDNVKNKFEMWNKKI